jgi:hypothetical protein
MPEAVRMPTSLWSGWWADLLELIDERTSALGITGAVATLILYLGFGRNYSYSGLFIAPLIVLLLLLAMAPAIGWMASSRLQRASGGLVGLGPSVIATVGGIILIATMAGDAGSFWWKSLAFMLPAGAAGLAVASRGVGIRSLLARRPLAVVTALLSSLWVPFIFVLTGGWSVEYGHRTRGPFMMLGIPVASLFLHLPWAARALSKPDESALLPLRVLGRCEVLLAALWLVFVAYGVASSVATGGKLGSATTGDLTYGPELVVPATAILIAVGWHGIRLVRWASSFETQIERTDDV